MAKAKTYFEQVPVAVAKQVAEQEMHVSHSGTISCAICGDPVELERCKIDEQGGAVHEGCYFERLSRPC